ncbi:MAG: hypothetical protein ACHQHN_09030 [Sphingobacteriales bacterium]
MLYGLGIYSFFYCQREYAVTLISFQTVVTIGVITGLIASIFLERELKYYLFSIILLGSLCMGAFFKLNRTFQHSQEVKIKARILNKTLQSAKIEKSRVTIEYDDFNKDIPIEYIQESLIGQSQFIELTVHKGGLGYYIITYHELVK